MPAALEQFEQEFAAWLGASHAVAAGFGRSALVLALRAVGVEGAGVLVPDFICTQVPEAVRRAGGRPLFYPVQRNLAISPEDFCSAVTPATRAAIVPHFFGRVLPQIAALAQICRERALSLVEDCALALGADRDGRRPGTLGDLAVFSLTKSDWCYGGGVVTTNAPAQAGKMKEISAATFQDSPRLIRSYGLLRMADFAANRPRWGRLAAWAGPRLERSAGLGGGNFYDVGRFDARMPPFAAVRARRLLRELRVNLARRRKVLRQLTVALRGAAHLLGRPQADDGDAGGFLLLQSPAGRALDWVDGAAREGVTLRPVWPAFQAPEPEQRTRELAWFANHLLVLEVHPRLAPREVDNIAACLLGLALKE